MGTELSVSEDRSATLWQMIAASAGDSLTVDAVA